jgi:hypothetical protein
MYCMYYMYCMYCMYCMYRMYCMYCRALRRHGGPGDGRLLRPLRPPAGLPRRVSWVSVILLLKTVKIRCSARVVLLVLVSVLIQTEVIVRTLCPHLLLLC